MILAGVIVATVLAGTVLVWTIAEDVAGYFQTARELRRLEDELAELDELERARRG